MINKKNSLLDSFLVDTGWLKLLLGEQEFNTMTKKTHLSIVHELELNNFKDVGRVINQTEYDYMKIKEMYKIHKEIFNPAIEQKNEVKD